MTQMGQEETSPCQRSRNRAFQAAVINVGSKVGAAIVKVGLKKNVNFTDICGRGEFLCDDERFCRRKDHYLFWPISAPCSMS